ncbi:MAG: hypothetical protein EB078_02330 [Proteobacteria bacterium]|nr:hypothetical protein [Pseudomonadota bacterium]NDC23052.1 hypothetical protein [Pseudomonadota bacterium]NDD03719.1 hypothetical protein [Pseudomonadota bacterium]NDG25641.1 hypothetical protein [Pseudomonadota bacterium]
MMSFLEFLVIAVLVAILLKRHSFFAWWVGGLKAWDTFKKTLHENPVREVQEYSPSERLTSPSQGVTDV